MSNKFLGLNSVNVLKDYIDKHIEEEFDRIEIENTEGTIVMPEIALVKDAEDNNYYWSIDGEFLVGDDGERIRANGEQGPQGRDGRTGPQGPQGPKGDNGTFANNVSYVVPEGPESYMFNINTNICTYIGNTTVENFGCDVYGSQETFDYGYTGKIINASPSASLVVTSIRDTFFDGVRIFTTFIVPPGKSVEVIGIRVNEENNLINRFFVLGEVTKPIAE